MQSEKHRLNKSTITKRSGTPIIPKVIENDTMSEKTAQFSFFREHLSSEEKLPLHHSKKKALNTDNSNISIVAANNNNNNDVFVPFNSNSNEDYESSVDLTIADTTPINDFIPEIIDTGLFDEEIIETADQQNNELTTPKESLQTYLFDDQDLQTSPTNPSSAQLSAPPPPMVREQDRHYTPRPNSVVIEYSDPPNRWEEARESRFQGNRLRLRKPWNRNDEDQSNGFIRFGQRDNINEDHRSSENNDQDKTYVDENGAKKPSSIQNILDDYKNENTDKPKLLIEEAKATTTENTPVTFNFSNFDFSAIKNLGSFGATTTTESPKPTTISKNLYNFIPYDSSDNSQFLLASSTTSSPVLPDFNSQVISKRTYPSFDFSGSSSSNSNNYNNVNPFAHLLTQNAPISSIGLPTQTGASLSLYSPLNYGGFNFDSVVSDSVTSTIANLPSGSIPLDLASSFTPVPTYYTGSTSSQNSGQNSGYSSSLYPPPSYSTNNNNNPYGSNSGQNAFGQNKIGTLTTRDGTVPSYNTITQGIHLLSLLGGNIPDQFGNNGDLNFGASSNTFAHHVAKPEFQIAALTGYGGSGDQFVRNLQNTDHSAVESRQLNTYAAPPQPEDRDQTSLGNAKPELMNWLKNLMSAGAAKNAEKQDDMDTAGSEIIVNEKTVELTPLIEDFGKKLVLKTSKLTRNIRRENNGPKSGFYI